MYVARRYGHENFYCLFDEIPEITYEKIGHDYIGSVTDEDENIIFSEYLGYQPYGYAFAGREISLKMKDGSVRKIKDHWFDCGSCKEHGEFVEIAGSTLENYKNVTCIHRITSIKKYFKRCYLTTIQESKSTITMISKNGLINSICGIWYCVMAKNIRM